MSFSTLAFSALPALTTPVGSKVIGFSSGNVDSTIAFGASNGLPYNVAGVLTGTTLSSALVTTALGFTPANVNNPVFTGTTITLAEGQNLVIGTTTGTKFGTATTQKLAFYNSTPIVQPTGDLITGLQNLGLIASITIALPTATTAVTQTAGDNTTKVATTAYVSASIANVTAIATTGGSTTLTAAQYGQPILRVTGVLASAATLVVPNNGCWKVQNVTTGAFTLTVKTSAGTGVVIAQPSVADVIADNTNVVFATPGIPNRTPQVVTSGTTYTTAAGTNTIVVECIAGGGGGGGCTSAAVSAAGGGGGAGGAYARKQFSVVPSTAYTIAIGAAGAAGSTAGGTGGTGGDTTFAVGAVTVTAKGGLGGVGMAAAAAATVAAGGAGVVSTLGDVNGRGCSGIEGLIFSGTVGKSGAGGAAFFGGNGAGLSAAAAGTAGVSGGGGSGGLVLNGSAAVLGGAGGAGMIVVTEYT